jgi:hypothetical protein
MSQVVGRTAPGDEVRGDVADHRCELESVSRTGAENHDPWVSRIEVDDEVPVRGVGVHAHRGAGHALSDASQVARREGPQQCQVSLRHLALDRVRIGRVTTVMAGELDREPVDGGEPVDVPQLGGVVKEHGKPLRREPVDVALHLEPGEHLACHRQRQPGNQLTHPCAG